MAQRHASDVPTTGKKRSSSTRRQRVAQPTNKAQASSPAPESNSEGTTVQHERRDLVAETAYFIAERRGFKPGHELEDWLQAEKEVEFRLGRM